MMYPNEFRYTKDHEWLNVEGDMGTVGITDYAQHELGDVVYVELPEVGATVAQGQVFGTIESVKAVSELFCPMGGDVVEVNPELGQHPEQVNADPHGAWMIKLKVTSAEEASSLLDAAQYTSLVG